MKHGRTNRRRRKLGLMKIAPELQFLQRWDSFFESRQLRYAGRLFPVDTFVMIKGRLGIYRVVSEPFKGQLNDQLCLDVEGFGEKLCVGVSEATRITN